MDREKRTEKISKIIRRETGIKIDQDRLIDLEIAVQDRLQKNSMNESSYISYLKSNSKEMIHLASIFTIQETSFYRNRGHFDRLKEQILPELIREKIASNNRKLKILSAGSATGEEPYTISMLLHEQIPDMKNWEIKILGTDINPRALETAARGVFSNYKLRNLDDYYKQKYFTLLSNGNQPLYRIDEKLKQVIEFRNVNLIHEPFELMSFSNVDIIFCENVIIYFEYDSIQRLIDNFYQIMSNSGYLFLGYSETLNMVKHNFALTWYGASYAYQKIPQQRQAPTDSPPAMEELKDDALLRHEIERMKNYPRLKKEILYEILRACGDKDICNCIYLFETLEEKLEIDELFYTVQAEFYYDRGDRLQAANQCRKAIFMNPVLLDPHVILALLYLELNMMENALFELKSIIYINSESILGFYYYAQYHEKHGEHQLAGECLQKAQQLLNANNGLLDCEIFPIQKAKALEISNHIMMAGRSGKTFDYLT